MKDTPVTRLARACAPYAVSVRHTLHMRPELAMREYATTQFIRDELINLGAEVLDYGLDTGCVGLIRGKKPGKGSCIGIRADIDALPMKDLCGKSYASQNEGVAHTCGHDAHTACLLGTARALMQMLDQFSGSVKLIFQPGEEGLCGAKLLKEKGVLENPHVDSMIALHCAPDVPLGSIAMGFGKIMAASDNYTLRYLGVSGHASRPYAGVNALLAAAHAAIALQEIVPNEIPCQEEAVINTCVLNSGTAHNIIPNVAEMKGTVRCLDPKVRDMIEQAIYRVADSVARLSRCGLEIAYERGVPPLINGDEETFENLRESVLAVVEDDEIVKMKVALGSEDFAVFSDALEKTCYYRIGCAFSDEKNRIMVHNGAFDFNDAAMPYGIAVHCQYVMTVNG